MHRRIALYVLLVPALSLLVSSAQAQAQGYVFPDNGRWVRSQTPVHRANVQRTRPSVASPAAEETAQSLIEPAAEDGQVPQTASYREASGAIHARPSGVVQTSFEEGAPIEMDEMPMDYPQESYYGGCGDPGCCCGEEAGFCPTTCYPTASCGSSLWIRAEYLSVWKKGMNLPPLVTTNPTVSPTLDDPNTVILFGDDTVNTDARSGGRFTLGLWADPCRTFGVEFAYTNLGNEMTSYYASSDDYTILGRPFYNIEEGEADADFIAFPNPAYTGWVSVAATTKSQGTELLFRRALQRLPYSQMDFLVGWRWMQLKDNLLISESATLVGVGTNNLSDHFSTRNDFHGAEFGVQWDLPISCCWTFEMLSKLAFGRTRSIVEIDGRQTSDPSQGLLALDSNSGTHSRNSFSGIAEIDLSVRRRFRCGIEASFGYTLMYWGSVMRAGDQIDLDIDPRQIPPDPQSAVYPRLPMSTTDFWAQGLHCGLEYVF